MERKVTHFLSLYLLDFMKPLILIFSFVSMLLVSSCSQENYQIEDKLNDEVISPEILSFALETANGQSFSAFLISNDTIHVKVDHDIDMTAITADILSPKCKIYIDSTLQRNGITKNDFSDFTHPIVYKVVTPTGEEKQWTVLLYDIPVLLIDTPQNLPITNKDNRIEGCVVKLVNEKGQIENYETAGIKGRGNSTWLEPKKPYNVKLDKKHGILGMKKSKHYVLLSNPYYDRTQLHNAIGLEMARLTDYPWVPAGEYVELVLNAHHQGLYYLVEKVRAEEGKIELTKSESVDSIGWLIETAFHDPSPMRFQTEHFNKTDGGYPLYWEVNDPDNATAQVVSECKKALDDLETLILDSIAISKGEYRKLIDIETAIDWMLVQEATLNQESLNPSNLFLYRQNGGGKIKFGPPWDFDAWTFGMNIKDRMFLTRPTFYFYHFLKDPSFASRLKEKWETYKYLWEKAIPIYIDKQSAYLYRSALRNEAMWPSWHPLNNYPSKSYLELVSDMKTGLLNQLHYMDSQIMSY